MARARIGFHSTGISPGTIQSLFFLENSSFVVIFNNSIALFNPESEFALKEIKVEHDLKESHAVYPLKYNSNIFLLSTRNNSHLIFSTDLDLLRQIDLEGEFVCPITNKDDEYRFIAKNESGGMECHNFDHRSQVMSIREYDNFWKSFTKESLHNDESWIFATPYKDRSVKLETFADVDRSNCKPIIVKLKSKVMCMCFIDRYNLAIGCANGDICIVTFTIYMELKSKRTLKWHTTPVNSLTFFGDYLLSGGDESVLVRWDMRKNTKEFLPRLGAPIKLIKHSNKSTFCVVTKENSLLVLNNNFTLLSKHSWVLSTLDNSNMQEKFFIDHLDLIMMPANNGRLQFFNLKTRKLDFELDVLQNDYFSKSKKDANQSPVKIQQISCIQNPFIFAALVQSSIKYEDRMIETLRIDIWHYSNLNFKLFTSIELDVSFTRKSFIRVTKNEKDQIFLCAINCCKNLLVWEFTDSKWIQIKEIWLSMNENSIFDFASSKGHFCILSDSNIQYNKINNSQDSQMKKISLPKNSKYSKIQIGGDRFILSKSDSISAFKQNGKLVQTWDVSEGYIKICTFENKIYVFYLNRCEVVTDSYKLPRKTILFHHEFRDFFLVDSHTFIGIDENFVVCKLTREKSEESNLQLGTDLFEQESKIDIKTEIATASPDDSENMINNDSLIKESQIKMSRQISELTQINPFALPSVDDLCLAVINCI